MGKLQILAASGVKTLPTGQADNLDTVANPGRLKADIAFTACAGVGI